MASIDLDPRTWTEIDVHDTDVLDHIDEVADDDCAPRFNIFQTDEGWAVQATVRTVGAVSSVSAVWLLPPAAQTIIDDAYEELENILVWESGVGLQVDLGER